jgi:RNA polymerase sigma-70 factor (ECF subfamily)
MRFAQLQAMAWLKRRNRLPLLIEPRLLELLASEALAESLECDAQRVALSACIEKLPADHRVLIASRYEPDASVNAMAAARHTSPKALSEMLRRIRRALLACVMKTLAEESYA